MEWSSSFGWADIIQIVILVFAVYAAFSANKNVSKSVAFSENRKLLDVFIEKISVLCNANLYSNETQDKTRAEFAGIIDRITTYTNSEKITKDVKALFETVKKKQDLFKDKKIEEFPFVFNSDICKALDAEIDRQKKLLYRELREAFNKKEEKTKKARSLTRLSEDEQNIINLYRSLNEDQKRETAQFLSSLCGIPDKTYTRPDVLGTFSHQKQHLSNDNQA